MLPTCFLNKDSQQAEDQQQRQPSSGQYKEGDALHMMIQVIAGGCVSIQPNVYPNFYPNFLSFPLLPEFVTGTIQ